MMRWTVALLLVANIVVAALVGIGSPARNPDAQLLDLQMNAQQVRVVGGGQDQPAPRRRPELPPAACLAWGPFLEAEAVRAREWLADLVPAEAVTSRAVTGSASWWVFTPPQGSRAEAQRRLAELKALGVTGYSLVEAEGEWRNAIELGVFPDEARAQAYLDTLQRSGVRGARTGERRGRAGIEWLVREPGEAVMARVLEIKQANFPASALGAIECPVGAAR